MSYQPSDPGSGAAGPRRRRSRQELTPDLLLGVALVALLTLVVALALGWVF